MNEQTFVNVRVGRGKVQGKLGERRDVPTFPQPNSKISFNSSNVQTCRLFYDDLGRDAFGYVAEVNNGTRILSKRPVVNGIALPLQARDLSTTSA